MKRIMPMGATLSDGTASVPGALTTYRKEVLVRGRPTWISCVDILGGTYELSGGPLKTLRLEDEWFDDVLDPEGVLEQLRVSRSLGVDLFSFWQRIPDVSPRFHYPMEWEQLAVLPIESYDAWLTKTLNAKNRNRVRKAERSGVVLREAAFDDEFIRGMAAIFNESPIRQGRSFWHYGKDVNTVKQQFSRYLHRESLIGAYYAGEMIGFVMLANAGSYAMPGQIISSLHHRDKSTNNALIGKAVEVCAKQGFPNLVYYHWGENSLSEFKRHCGFEKVGVPRYFVPLTAKGRIAIRYGAHRGTVALLPDGLRSRLKELRTKVLNARHRITADS